MTTERLDKLTEIESEEDYVRFLILRLAAFALDVRACLTPHELDRLPALERALDALEQVFQELYDKENSPDLAPCCKPHHNNGA